MKPWTIWFNFLFILYVYSWKPPSNPTEFIKNSLSLTSIVSRVTHVDKNSGLCKCPFHKDDSPSMKINEVPGYYYCFGCGESGNVIKFISKCNQWSYSRSVGECLKLMNNEISLDSLLPSSLSADFSTKQRPKPIFKKPLGKPLLQQQDHSILEEMDTHGNEEDVSNPIKNRLLNILHLSNSYFVTRLFKDPDAYLVRSYLQSRNISVNTAKVFQLGYAPKVRNGGEKATQTNSSVWSFWEDIKPHSLLSWFSNRAKLNGSDPIQAAVELEQAGLVVNASKYGRTIYFENHNFYDRFRHRLMIPIRDIQGNILGYGGRELPDNSTQSTLQASNETVSSEAVASPSTMVKNSLGKYVNTPTTPVFKKKETLFNIDIAAKSRQTHQSVIIVEGYFDVIALYEIGVKNVVASMGTALSLSQLFRAANLTTTGEVIILFDQDAPGQRATERVSALIDGLQNPAILKKYQNLLKEIRHPVVTIKSASISESIQFLMNSESSLDISTGASSSPIVDTSTVLFDGDEPPLSDSIRPAPTTVAQTFHGHSMKKLSKIKDCADVVQSFEKDIAQRIILTMIELSKPLKTIKF